MDAKLITEALQYLVAHPQVLEQIAAEVPTLVTDIKAVVDAIHGKKS